ncbi:calcium-binding protein [Aliisedimentitalea scapharcae]|uniref:Calcium-binding protein n=1 Tax=Aliisedimentitalea scapharcae TaxID=1524259 RepID=A0ABZ2XY32_9RHOB
MQVFDADGEPIGDAVSPAGGLPRGNTHGARVDEDGNIVILRSSPSARLIEYVVDTSGALISNALVYAPKDDPSAHQISNNSSRVFRPDGGYVALSGSILQNYTADGRPDGLAIDLGYPSGSSMSQMALGKGGDFWVRWNSRTADSTDQEFTGGYAAFEIIIPRSLTDEADLEFLSSPEAVDGGAGNDVILGSDGVDRLLGSDGDDVLMGGAGDDLMRGDAGNDMLIGGDGAADTAFYQGGWQDYDVLAEDELVYISGTGAASGDGTDRLSGIERIVFSDMDVEVSDFVTQFGTAFSGTDADDTFHGTSGNNLLSGLAGDDTLNGRDGVDTLYGGDGNDVLTGGRSPDDLHDEIHGQAGNDILRGGYGNDLVLGGDGNDTIDGGRGVDTVAGGTGNDADHAERVDQEPKQVGRTRIGTAELPIAGRSTLGNAILSGDAMNFGTGGGNRTHTGFRPTDFLTRYGFHRHPGLGRLGSGLSLHHHRIRPVLGAARLVSTPSPVGAWLGIAI